MIDPSVLAEKTAALLEDLGRISEIGQFILVGGTALSLQLGHRISLDLDFMVPEPVLPRGAIQPIVSALAWVVMLALFG
ncbi:MAG: nucleotidyl transferase AbiEii/AbiGii toxin family protein [Gammaproteobacteria bacterium SHHR-1]|uniref:nucleotidyl transferase AbiEii/AbiGii toxin family protein n=1 Tax=Magnetovirga frankeli TaxID=947516 RepID=UPI00129382C0|nr:nucleotidyl transferase AbiEii/AbiGii toxin family protein [gamma proteobacterium SS-5]